MQLNCVSARLAFTVATIAIVAATPLGTSTARANGVSETSPTESAKASEVREVRRLHAHFDSVLIELDQRDVASLSAAQRVNRSRVIDTLREYNQAGVFPRNYDFVAHSPYFIDRKTGHLCAFAYLLASTGRRDIVNRVAKVNNNVWVEQLRGDSALAAWFDSVGITPAEGVRVQVPYAMSVTNSDSKLALASGVGLIGSIGASVWNASGNRNGEHRSGQILGLVAGATSVAAGTRVISESGHNTGIHQAAIGVAAVGLVSMAWSLHSAMRHSHIMLAEADAKKAETKRAAAEASIAPMLPMGKGSGPGLSMQIRF